MWAIIFILTRHKYIGRKGKWITNCSILWSTVQSSVQKCWNQESAQECEQTCFFLANLTCSWVARRRHIGISLLPASLLSSCYNTKNQKSMFYREPLPLLVISQDKFLLTENVKYWCIFSHHWYLITEVFGRDKTYPSICWINTGLPSAQQQRFCNIFHLWFNPKLREEE